MFITIADRLSDPWMLPFSRPRLHCHAKSTERKRHMHPNGSRRQIKGYEHGYGKAFRNDHEWRGKTNRLPGRGRGDYGCDIARYGFAKLYLVLLYIEETRSEKVSKTAGELCLTWTFTFRIITENVPWMRYFGRNSVWSTEFRSQSEPVGKRNEVRRCSDYEKRYYDLPAA